MNDNLIIAGGVIIVMTWIVCYFRFRTKIRMNQQKYDYRLKKKERD